MNVPAELNVTCVDFLKDNPRHYARKAKRKKIVLIGVEAVSNHSGDLRLLLGASKLTAGGQSYNVETPAVIHRKLSAFTWDFLLYLILDFHPVLAALDLFFLLTGPVYNWRLRRQLKLLSNGEMVLRPGESAKVVLGFRGVPKKPEELETMELCYRRGDGEKQMLQCGIA